MTPDDAAAAAAAVTAGMDVPAPEPTLTARRLGVFSGSLENLANQLTWPVLIIHTTNTQGVGAGTLLATFMQASAVAALVLTYAVRRLPPRTGVTLLAIAAVLTRVAVVPSRDHAAFPVVLGIALALSWATHENVRGLLIAPDADTIWIGRAIRGVMLAQAAGSLAIGLVVLRVPVASWQDGHWLALTVLTTAGTLGYVACSAHVPADAQPPARAFAIRADLLQLYRSRRRWAGDLLAGPLLAPVSLGALPLLTSRLGEQYVWMFQVASVATAVALPRLSASRRLTPRVLGTATFLALVGWLALQVAGPIPALTMLVSLLAVNATATLVATVASVRLTQAWIRDAIPGGSGSRSMSASAARFGAGFFVGAAASAAAVATTVACATGAAWWLAALSGRRARDQRATT